jgi:LacI family transcriptional regulator
MSGKRRTSASVTIVDIAREAGVSKSTVSLVLKGSSLVADDTRDRVSKAMAKLGYVYNRGAANLRGAQSSIVGMVINDLANPFFAELAIGIERVLRTSGYIPFISNTAESVVRQAEVVRSMREHGASGIILCPALETEGREVNDLLDLGMPLILAIRRVPGARTSLVASDNTAGATRITAHLISLGHRRIAFLGGMEPMAVRKDRIAGFTRALEEAGMRADPALMLESMPSKDGGFTAMSNLLARREWPTAVVCFNDVVAIGAMLAMGRKGVVAGRDMAITGFDDTAEARQVSPPLTTIAVDAGDLGERAAQMLLRQIASGSRAQETYIGEARLVVRESCCPPPRERKIS